MKKILVTMLVAAIFLSLASCSFIKLPSSFDLSGLLGEVTNFDLNGLLGDVTNFDINDIINGLMGSGNSYQFGRITINLPEGFSVTESNGTKIAVYEDYPTHGDNISFVSSTGSADSMTEDALKAAFAESFGSVENFKYSKSEGDGYTLIRADFDVVYNNIRMHEISCTYIIGTDADVVTFTSVTGEFDSAFETSIASVTVNE